MKRGAKELTLDEIGDIARDHDPYRARRGTVNRLDDIKARVVAATEGPWRVQLDGFDYGPWDEVYVANARGQYPCTPCGVPNAEFIAHARTDVPALVAAVEAVLALHKPVGGPSDPRCCPVCVDLSGEYAETYPCGTATAILAALGEDE